MKQFFKYMKYVFYTLLFVRILPVFTLIDEY